MTETTHPLDARVRELWKAVAITASEHEGAGTAVERADFVTLAFINRFYPNDSKGRALQAAIREPGTGV